MAKKTDKPEIEPLVAQAGAAALAGTGAERVQSKVYKKGGYHDMTQYKNAWLPGAWKSDAWAFDAWLPGAWL